MSKPLGQLLEDRSDEIIGAWAEKLKRIDQSSFADYDLNRIKTTWAKGFEAYVAAIKEGRHSLIRNFIERISTLRGSPDIHLTELQQAFLAFKEIVIPLIEDEYSEIEEVCAAFKKLDGSVNQALLELSHVYRRSIETTMSRYVEQISQLDEQMEEVSMTDGLTGLFTFGYLEKRLKTEISRAKRYGRPLAVVLIRIDGFEEYQESFGRPNADLLLKKIGELMTKGTRDVDIWARFGRHELIAALPETEKMDATIVAERLRKQVEADSFAGAESLPRGKITVSAGVACYPYEAKTVEGLIELLQSLLEEARKKGSNQVCFLLR